MRLAQDNEVVNALAADRPDQAVTRAPKQQHTAKRIFERLRDEHGFGGGAIIGQGAAHIAAAWRLKTRPVLG